MAVQPIVHIEIPADDAKAASQFYADVFGWQIAHAPEFDYYMFTAEGGPGGGWVSTKGEYASKAGDVRIYLDSNDIDADLARIEKHGGKVVEPKMEVPGVGWLAIWTDPTGNRIGIFQYTNRG